MYITGVLSVQNLLCHCQT